MHLLVNGITLNVEVGGAGRPLLLLHGFTGSAAVWPALAARFAPHRCTVAVDLIGHGQSDTPADAERYRMEQCVADLLALLDTLEIAQTDVLGYSMGGRVALQMAATAPARVSTLALPPTRRWPTRSSAMAWRRSSIAGSSCHCSPARPRCPPTYARASTPSACRIIHRAWPTACAAWAPGGKARCGIGYRSCACPRC